MSSHSRVLRPLRFYVGIVFTSLLLAVSSFGQVTDGNLVGTVYDASGKVVTDAAVGAKNTATGVIAETKSDSSGTYRFNNLPVGTYDVTVSSAGFASTRIKELSVELNKTATANVTLSVGTVAESVEVSANYGNVDLQSLKRDAKKNAEKQQYAASVNVTNLQQRMSGVLPVRVNVPRAGNSYHFVRPLVLDEETKVSFTYKSR